MNGKSMKFSDLIDNVEVLKILNNADFSISDINYDSRKVQSDSIFVALRGEVSDGHNYIESSIASGAKAIICEEIPKELDENCVYVLVENTRVALAQLSHKFYRHPSNSLKVIGITGTNGKTTITFLLKEIFESAGHKCGIIGTTGIFIGDKEIPATHTTPEAKEISQIMNEMVQAGVEFCIMEVSSHALVQHRADIIKFDAAVFTNLSHDHLDYHKTLQNYANAKKILFDMLDENAFAIINTDDEYAEHIASDTKAKIIRIASSDDADYKISSEEINISSTNFYLNDFAVKLNLLGRFNIENSALAYATSLQFGISDAQIISALKIAKGAPGRMQRININSGAAAIIDYAHTPDALEKALKTCREIISQQPEKSSLICVFGCGGDRDKTKRPVMGRISNEIADLSVITNDNPRTENPDNIIEDILSGVTNQNSCEVIKDRQKAIEFACKSSQKNDIILIAGKGHEKYQIIGKEKFHFDDVEEVKRFI